MDKALAESILSGNVKLKKTQVAKNKERENKLNPKGDGVHYIHQRSDSILLDYKRKIGKEVKNGMEGETYIISNKVKDANNMEILKVKNVSMKQAVLIDTTIGEKIQVEGKVNNVRINQCHDVKLLVESTIASLEIVNCDKIMIQVLKFTPTISIAGCSDVYIYLTSEESKNCDILTCKSFHVNVNLKSGDEWVEVPIPDQFLHKIVGDKVTTKVSGL